MRFSLRRKSVAYTVSTDNPVMVLIFLIYSLDLCL